MVGGDGGQSVGLARGGTGWPARGQGLKKYNCE